MSDLFAKMEAARIAFDTCGSSANLIALEKAEADYSAAFSVAESKWLAIPACVGKCIAEENANDTHTNHSDQLTWLEIALGTYELL